MAKKKHSVELVIGAVNEATKDLADVKDELKKVAKDGLGAVEEAAADAEKEVSGAGESLKLLAGAEILGAVTKAAGLAGQAVLFLKDHMVEAVEAANIQDAAERDLQVALELSGKATDGAADRIIAYAAQLQNVSTVGDETSIRMAALAINMGANEKQAKLATKAAIDLAAATGKNANEALMQLLKTLGGYSGELGEVFPKLRNLTKAQLQNGEGIRVIAERYDGAASSALTFEDRVTQITNILGDQQETLGQSITRSAALNGVMEAVRDTLAEMTGIADVGVSIGDGFAGATVELSKFLQVSLVAITQFGSALKGPLALLPGGAAIGDLLSLGEGSEGLEKLIPKLAEFQRRAEERIKEKGGFGTRLDFESRQKQLEELLNRMLSGKGKADAGDPISEAVTGLFKMQQRLKAMDDPAEAIIQKFGRMRDEVAGLIADGGDTPLARSVLARITSAEEKALEKLAAANRKKMQAAKAKSLDETRRIQKQEMQQWAELGSGAAAAFGAAFASAIRGEEPGSIGKALLRSLISMLPTVIGALGGGPAGAIFGSFATSAFGGLIQHGGSPGLIPTGHGGLFSSEETNVRALRGEGIANRQAMSELGGAAGMASLNAGLGGPASGMTVHIHATDTQTLDDAIRRGTLGDRLAMAFRRRRGPLAGAF